MKKFAYAPLAMMMAVAPQSHSGEVVPFGYLNMPFGPGATQEAPAYGFSLAQTETSNSAPVANLLDTKRPPLLDLRFKGDELDALELNGVNALNKSITYNADGTTSTEFGLDWQAIVIGGIAAGIIYCALECRHDSGSSEGRVIDF